MPETQIELGKALAASGSLDQAEKLFLQVLRAESHSALAEAAHYQLSQIYRKLGRADDADRELRLFEEIRRKKR
jgi:tetratricopeptide (TPR) repeat protein